MTIWNIAHRGGAGLRAENTLAAFRHAMELGCDGAELDVQLSTDGVVVIHHDFRLNPALTRKDGRWLTGEGERIKDLSFGALQAFDLGHADPASDYARCHPDLVPTEGGRIPSLADLVAICPADFRLLVELKSSTDPASADPLALADAAFDVMKDRLERTIFVGFDWRSLAQVRLRSSAACCWFTTDKLQGDVRPVLDFIKAAGGQGWFPYYPDVTDETLKEARSRDLQTGVWTVNDAAEMTRLIAMGVDAICTDRPDLLQSLKQRR